MTEAEILDRLSNVGAIITDSHIVYTSGRHGRAYVNKDALYLHPITTATLCKEMAAPYAPSEIDVVAGPTIGGVILAQWVAAHLSAARQTDETLAVYAEEEVEGEIKRRVFKRGYDEQVAGKRIVIVEDVLNTGGSARQVVEAVRALGGTVVGLSVLCNRGNVHPEDVGSVPIHALTTVSLESWAEDECPLCRDDVPVNVVVGKGKAFLARKAQG